MSELEQDEDEQHPFEHGHDGVGDVSGVAREHVEGEHDKQPGRGGDQRERGEE